MFLKAVITFLLAFSTSTIELCSHPKRDLLSVISTLEGHIQEAKLKVNALPGSQPIRGVVCVESANCPYPYKQVLDDCFYLSKSALKWPDAREYCRGMQGDLATPKDVYALKSYVLDNIEASESVWLGASQETEEAWKWLDGRPIESHLFSSGQPDNAGGIEHCLDLRIKWHPTLNDYQCHVPQLFVCQYKYDL